MDSKCGFLDLECPPIPPEQEVILLTSPFLNADPDSTKEVAMKDAIEKLESCDEEILRIEKGIRFNTRHLVYTAKSKL